MFSQDELEMQLYIESINIKKQRGNIEDRQDSIEGIVAMQLAQQFEWNQLKGKDE